MDTTNSKKSKHVLKLKNQPHTPKKYADENQKVRLFLKTGGNTTLICKNITSLAATSLALYIIHYCKRHNSKVEGTFIQTK